MARLVGTSGPSDVIQPMRSPTAAECIAGDIIGIGRMMGRLKGQVYR